MATTVARMQSLPAHQLGAETTTIPLVTHIITDDDIGVLQGTKLQPINLVKVVKLLTDPHSSMLYDRHLHALRKVVRHYSKGFPMKDIVLVFKILNVCADRVLDQPLYEDPVCDLLQLCSLPYLKEKTSDELVYQQIVVESVSQLGYLMRVPSAFIRKQICKTLVNFYCEKPPPQEVQKHKASELSYNQEIIESSDISEALVKSQTLVENDQDLKIEVLSVLQHFSKHSARNCDQMLRADGALRICSHLMDPDPTGQLLFQSVDILWNLLENGDISQVAQQLNNTNSISQLRDAFILQLTQGYSHYDRQLRNDLLVLATLVASASTEAPFVETGFVRQLVLFATFQEIKNLSALVKHLKLSTNHEDFELKKTLFNILVVLSKNPTVVQILSEGHLLPALFSYVKPNKTSTRPMDWKPSQFEELQLLAMACLSTLCPLMIEDYMTCQGSTRLLLLLEWCVGPEDYGGHGNSFHGTGGRGNKRAQMHHCLRLIRSVISTGNEEVLQDFVDQGAINQICNILTNALRSGEADDVVDIEMQADMLLILSCMCDGDMHRKDLFGKAGVDVTVAYLKTNPKLLSSGLGHHRLLLSAVDCVWCTIVSCYTTEDYFLEQEGAFLLIDLLEVCPKNMLNLVLGCLLDLCENPKAIHHVLTWRGKDNISAPHLLCHTWRTEEKELGVKREATGAIEDAQQPLMGLHQERQGIRPLPAKCPSQAIVDVYENKRSKIYSLFCKIGFTDLPDLTVHDHVTLTIIEKYLDFKVGEVWSEVISELDLETIRPITPDREALEAVSRAVEERVQMVVATQSELLEAQQNQDGLDEQEFYAEIRENHRQKEKTLNEFADLVARTSNYSLLKAAKERQELSVDASRVQTKYKESKTFHETDLKNVNTTTFGGRYVAVDSTPSGLTGGPLAKYDPLDGTLRKRKVIKELEIM